ncbi:MBL fold metallo-hydrolase [Granulicoccus phenolivorans]|uniref:MBL fold metallo-hydrolase n=1 Tax=Granulicoccus phenolivorans TaxID=266854 RepID=UPI0003F7FFC2|nr:MBL fold metallo-hydrolase [Granulicoccus phenolivorans]
MPHTPAHRRAWTQSLTGTLSLTKFAVNKAQTNVYLLAGPAGALLIDAAADAPTILRFLGRYPLQTIVTTHSHTDQFQALAEVAAATRARLVCGRPDRAVIEDATGTIQEPVWTGSRVDLPGGGHLDVIGASGHTPGSIMLAYRPPNGPIRIFAGDCILHGAMGRTDTPAALLSLVNVLRAELLDRYPEDTVIHPGHGEDTTLRAERPSLTAVSARRSR